MRIIFIPGIKTYEFYLNGWRKDLAQQFPDDEIIFLNDEFYMWWQMEKLETLVQKGVDLLNDGKPTVIVAHSFGGIIAKTVIDRATQGNVSQLITMASPHTMDYLGVRSTKRKLKTPLSVNTPHHTFGGYLDPIVPYKYTMLTNSTHQNYWCEHLGFLLFPWVRKTVVSNIKPLPKKKS